MSMSSNEQKSVKERFSQVYEVLKSEILQDSVFEYDSASRKWIQEMLDYNVPGGKLGRGVALIETLSLLKQTKLNEQDLFLASVLGWCIQWFVACALILDDIMDASYSRRGKTCLYRLPNVGNIAINDGALLWNHIYRFLRYHFRELPYYVHLIELFNECMFQTASGQMIDLISTRDDFSNFTPQLHHRISKFKTAYGTFYLPFACALLMLGEDLDEYIQVKEILVDMGVYFQVQDDYLDSYGNPETVGKIGTDIQDFKCSWLAVKALELCNEDQKKVFCENYGKADEASVGKVKALYNELNLEGVFADYEMEVHEKLTERIQAVPSKAVQSVLKGYLSKIYKRKK